MPSGKSHLACKHTLITRRTLINHRTQASNCTRFPRQMILLTQTIDKAQQDGRAKLCQKLEYVEIPKVA